MKQRPKARLVRARTSINNLTGALSALYAPMATKNIKALPAPEKKKKKKEEYDVSAEPKKKKKKRTELALVDDEDDEPKVSKNKTKMMLKTQFGKGAEKILRMLEQDDTDPAIALLYKRLLMSVVDILPMAELGIRKSKGTRGTYQFVQLISSVRELMVDIQSAQDRGMMGDMLVRSVIQPAFGDLAQDTVQEFSMIAADAKSTMTPEEYERFAPLLRESRARLANRMTFHYRAIQDGVVSYLQR